MSLHLDHLPLLLVSLAGTMAGTWVLSMLVDFMLGVGVSVKNKTFDSKQLGRFLETQFVTAQARALLGLVVAAALAPNVDVRNAAWVAFTGGCAMQVPALVIDIKAKIKVLAGL